MDIVRFKGGLGNQMFQYALVEALRNQGREVHCNLGYYRKYPDLRPFILNQVFTDLNLNEIDDQIFRDIDNKWQIIKNNKSLLKQFKKNKKERFFYVENEDSKYDKDIFETKNCTFVGFWQSDKYFNNIGHHIKKIYDFKNIEPKLYKLGKQLSKNYISIHVRRSDYLLQSERYCTFSMEYYDKAIKYISSKISEAKFIFFSDDKNWVRNNFKLNDMIICETELFDNYKDWYDMYLMTLCKGNIIANSSFSWWGAWLNKNLDSIVIAPKIWLNGCETPDIWCENWIRM